MVLCVLILSPLTRREWKSKNVLDGRFTDSQVNAGLIRDVLENPNITDVVCICKFKDGSMDVFGDMLAKDLSFGVKIIDSEFIHPVIGDQCE